MTGFVVSSFYLMMCKTLNRKKIRTFASCDMIYHHKICDSDCGIWHIMRSERYMAYNEEEGCMKIMIILMTMMFIMMMTVIIILVMILTMMIMMILIIISTMGIIVYLYWSVIDTKYASFNMLHTECIFPSAIRLINMFIAATVRNTLYVSLAADGSYSSL